MIILAVLCFIAAIILGFFVIGYPTTAMLFAALGCLFLVFFFLKKMKNRRAADIIKRIIYVLLVIGIVMIIVAEIPIVTNSKTDANSEVDYLVVLGAGLRGTTPSYVLVDRLRATLNYLETYPNTIAIVSGGQGPGEDITEAEAMRRWLENRGIDPSRIIKEDKSTSTYENLKFSFEIMEDHSDGDPTVAIVSNEFHLYRAKYMAKEQGYDVKVIAAETYSPVLKLNYFIREAFAVWYMWVF